ncbi:cell division protein ZapA [Segnochrobactrum spirostomi]|uniref:Cell division protein ZapA n=1 Tax=Segnochrobactrum spirostomi TaxID=2608987 RepID=A0A6A7Y2S5_9HYPH|nr:cell division protein ZapA [Segnochrobactrum spirostomi]MQT13394.1 cell division protein ZapA [Segnochrobactrum spirostomi]
MAQVNVSINGRNYRMACDDGEEERLLALGRRFDECIQQLRGGFGEIGDQRLTVMAGVMMADRLNEAEATIKALQAEVAGLRDSRAAIATRADEVEASMAQKIDQVAERLEALANVLVPQSLS